jgi:hypothetical protein
MDDDKHNKIQPFFLVHRLLPLGYHMIKMYNKKTSKRGTFNMQVFSWSNSQQPLFNLEICKNCIHKHFYLALQQWQVILEMPILVFHLEFKKIVFFFFFFFCI